MRIAIRELLRRPGRFITVGGALTLLVLLLVVLGGFLDGLQLSSTGSYRAHEGRLLVLAADVDLQLSRSRLDAAVADEVAAVDGVADVGVLASVATPAAPPDGAELVDVVVYGYELATDVLPDPPGPGEAVADRRLRDVADVAEGDVLELGPAAVEVTVTGWVDDVSEGSPTLWVEPGTWREVAGSASPTGAVPEGVVPALVVAPADGEDLEALADRIDEATGTTETATAEEVVAALEVVAQQTAAFQGIISVTFVVTLLVVALFFALITIERVRLYAVLKALGGRTPDLVRGIAAQAVLIALGALVVGGVLAMAFIAVLPADLPIRVTPPRLVIIVVGTLLTALLGALLTLRRLLRIDPAEAIG